MNSINFNINHGFLEGIVRGFKVGILKQSDYMNLMQCETLEGGNIVLFKLFWPHGSKCMLLIL
jgi:hypothetical protein